MLRLLVDFHVKTGSIDPQLLIPNIYYLYPYLMFTTFPHGHLTAPEILLVYQTSYNNKKKPGNTAIFKVTQA
jgi:hypothetical protein